MATTTFSIKNTDNCVSVLSTTLWRKVKNKKRVTKRFFFSIFTTYLYRKLELQNGFYGQLLPTAMNISTQMRFESYRT